MSAKYVLISRFPLKNNVTPSSITGLKSTSEKKYFFCEENDIHELLELRSFNDIKEIPWVEGELEAAFHNMASLLSGDIRRDLVKYV